MTEPKTYSKKLTESGGAACVLTFIALLLSCAGVLTEYIGVSIYNQYYITRKSSIFAADFISFVDVYEKPIILTLVTFVLFIVLFVSRRKKKTGGEIPAIMLICSIAFAVKPICDIAQMISTGEFSATMRYASDGDKFRAVLNLSISALPLVSCFLLLIAGLVLCTRLAGEDFTVSVPMTKRMAVTPAQTQTPAPQNAVEPKFEYGHSNYIEPDVADNYKKNNGAEPVNAVISDAKPDNNENLTSDDNSAEDNTAVAVETAENEELTCSVCGSKSPFGSKFCKKCGAGFDK